MFIASAANRIEREGKVIVQRKIELFSWGDSSVFGEKLKIKCMWNRIVSTRAEHRTVRAVEAIDEHCYYRRRRHHRRANEKWKWKKKTNERTSMKGMHATWPVPIFNRSHTTYRSLSPDSHRNYFSFGFFSFMSLRVFVCRRSNFSSVPRALKLDYRTRVPRALENYLYFGVCVWHGDDTVHSNSYSSTCSLTLNSEYIYHTAFTARMRRKYCVFLGRIPPLPFFLFVIFCCRWMSSPSSS